MQKKFVLASILYFLAGFAQTTSSPLYINSNLWGANLFLMSPLDTIPLNQQRILIDIGGTSNYGGTLTSSPNLNGNTWNNMTDARPGIQVINALTINNQLSGISIEVINRLDGTYSPGSLGIGSGNTAGIINDYPASATTDHALIHSSATNGRWKIKGLLADKTYTIKFWGTRSNTTAPRYAEIKRADETVWISYNATANTNYNHAAVFNITGKTEMDFDIRTKAGSDFSALNILDIYYGSDTVINPPPPVNLPPVARAGSDTTIQLPTDSVTLRGCGSYDPELGILKYKWRKISGPVNYTMPVDSLCSVKVKGLVTGVYSFELNVTDTAGLSGKDTVLITVNSLITTNWPPQVTPLCNRPYKIVVVGSSTAYGTGANPIDSSWVRKFNAYLFIQNTQVQIINIATLGLTSWDVSPTGTIVPFPFTVDTLRNITRALSYNPDAVILNLPSNDVARGIPTDSIHNNYNRIAATANARNVPLWVTTTQPRDGLSPAEKILQMELRDWINTSYGNKSVDFWSTVANPDGTINTLYSAGDGVHLNNYGHHVLFTRIVEEKIWDTICKRKNLPPIAKAGNDTSLTATPYVVTLNGAASFDPEGSLLTFAWRIINSSNGSIALSNTVNPVFSTTVPGSYVIELKCTDNLGLVGMDSLTLLVNVSNLAPVANAGVDQTITLPVNTTILNAAASFDSDGSITAYKWKKISGAGSVSITDSTAVQTQVNFTLPGQYNFQLSVTDNEGAVANDTVIIIVNTIANTVPVANAGINQIITLPVNTTSLNAGASFDPDGSLTAYKWKKISGTGTVIIIDSTAVTTTVNFVTTGAYVFELTVTDNGGAAAKDSVTITVNPDPNTPPVCNAGPDKNIQLPANRVLLDGRNSYDPEGSILSYNWSLVSGPSASQVLTAAKDTTSVTFVNEGIYIFRLTVTDVAGLSSADNVTVTVLPVPGLGKKIKVNIFGGSNPYVNTQWNNWNMNAGLTSSKFLYEDASLSNLSAGITASGLMADNGANYASGATVCPPPVLRYNSANTSIRTLTINGCNPAKKYNLEFYASRSNNGNSTVYQVGNLLDTISTSSNINDYARFQNISADVNGKITIKLSRIGTWNYLAGFMLTELDAVATFTSLKNGEGNIEDTIKTSLPKPEDKGLVFPNPAREKMYVKLPGTYTGKYAMDLSNIYGKIVWQKRGEKVKNNLLEIIDIKGMPKGMYILQINYPQIKLKQLVVIL
jgi:lysophospholipase L1-like esterase